MKHLLNRVVLKVSCILWLGLEVACSPTRAATPAAANSPAQSTQPTTLPTSTDPVVLEGAAVDAVRTGDFGLGEQILARAATISNDAQIRQMSQWVDSFQANQKTFSDQREKEFDKAVGNVHLLLSHKMDGYAIDEAARAYLLAKDQEAFRHEPWIDDLVKESSTAADQDESTGLWLKALRMYADLGEMEPANPIWKNKLKLATLRVRLLLIYTPPRLKKLQEAEAHDREAADELLRASTRPSALAAASTTQPGGGKLSEVDQLSGTGLVPKGPTTQPIDQVADELMPSDWRDMMKGIQFDMLFDALELADRQYYRDVTFQSLLEGGLNGLQAVITTDGLEDAFPGLKDSDKKEAFLATLSTCKAAADASTPDTAEDVMTQCLNQLRDENQKTVQLPEEVFVSEFADGAFSKLDPFSTIIWPYDVEELEKTTEGEFGGVGISIEPDEAGNGIKVVQPLEDTPAFKAGIRPGDVITRINGKSSKNISLDGAVKVITGTPGTNVTITVRSLDGTVKDYTLTRELIKVASIKGFAPKDGGKWDYMIDPEQRIAYIRLTSFSKTTADDLASALTEVKTHGARAIILDLRYNPGGLLQAAKDVVNEFISEGVIVSTHADRATVNPPTIMMADAPNLQTKAPLVVLVNQYSASASEIVSGALKDQKRALIVGELTFGKGSVQMLFPLETKKAYLKLTTSHYYLPNGRCIHREENSTTWGVDPDVRIDLTPEQMRNEIDARTDLDVPENDRIPDKNHPTTAPSVGSLLKADPQLSAALLILRLQLTSGDATHEQAALR